MKTPAAKARSSAIVNPMRSAGSPAGWMARRKANVFMSIVRGGEKLGFEPVEAFLG
jgi:hypothetical protein